MWKPTSEFERIVQMQVSRRLDDLSRLRTKRQQEMAHQAAARGTIRTGGFYGSVFRMTEELFFDAGTGIVADFLGLADDTGDALEALDWLERKFGITIERVSEGLQRSLKEGPRAVHLASEHAGHGIAQTASRLKRDAAIAFGRVRLRAARPPRISATAAPTETRDFFISHAGEDRPAFVGPLVEELTARRGRSVWYSEFELTIGDALLGRIDEGLRTSRYGVVVLSPDFFRKPWARAELDGLAARAFVEGRKVILPVWHNLDHAAVAAHSPTLAGLLGTQSSIGVPAVVDAILAAAKDLQP